MTKYTVVFTQTARQDALAATDYIAAKSLENAVRWYENLEKAINSLNSLPHRCGRAREADSLKQELRQYIYGAYRIIFEIDEDAETVRILHVRHGARRAISDEASTDED